VSGNDCRLGAEGIKQSHHVTGQMQQGVLVDIGWPIGVTIAAHVGRDSVEARLAQSPELMAPGIPGRGSHDTARPAVPFHARRNACEYRWSRRCDVPSLRLSLRRRRCPYTLHQIGVAQDAWWFHQKLHLGHQLVDLGIASREPGQRRPELDGALKIGWRCPLVSADEKSASAACAQGVSISAHAPPKKAGASSACGGVGGAEVPPAQPRSCLDHTLD